MDGVDQGRGVPDVVEFGRGHPSPWLLPDAVLRDAMVNLSSTVMRECMTYAPSGGSMAMRHDLAGFLRERYRFAVNAEEVMWAHGISLSMSMACQLFAGRARERVRGGQPSAGIVVCEDPTYFYATEIFATAGLDPYGIEVDRDGLRVDLLEQALARGLQPDLVYCMPSFHNPTAVILSPARAERMVALAAEYDFLIIADEPYNLLHFGSAPPPCMMEYDRGRARVLSLGSFSKLLGPGLRSGWIHGHPSLIETVSQHGVLRSGGGLNPLMFAAIHDLIRTGRLADNVDHLRSVYGSRARALTEALRERLHLDIFCEPEGGYFLWATMPGAEGSRGLLDRATSSGVSYLPGTRCAVSRELDEWARFCFAYYDEEVLVSGVERLAQVLNR